MLVGVQSCLVHSQLGGAGSCERCADRLDGLLDEVQRLYAYLILIINRSYTKDNFMGVFEGAVNLDALDAAITIDRVVATLSDHVATLTGRQVQPFGIETVEYCFEYEVPLPMGGQAAPTLRRATWLRSETATTRNILIATEAHNFTELVEMLSDAVELADSMITARHGQTLIGSCAHCDDSRELWVQRGERGAVCRSCWKMNGVEERLLAELRGEQEERLMTATGISRTLAALDIELSPSQISSWDANERRRVTKARAKGIELPNRLEVKAVQEFRNSTGGTRKRPLYSFEQVFEYWSRVNKRVVEARVEDMMIELTNEVESFLNIENGVKL